jgi:hypothetical protein
MTAFHVGQKVVCIKQHTTDAGFTYPPVGTLGTVREIVTCPYTGRVGIRLVEHRLPLHEDGDEYMFSTKHFRPVVERKTSIEIFTAMLNKPTVRVTA